ncbi:Oleoyl-acyl carrier protein thioesterase 1 [Carex littledalei]|uniref:Oleoyl-acyl carrier protein thioesterase 1 n=1 Tax=Carex littledalei TaxID=544730 RepID=A0A833RPK6_9POAL|nr:Oleoyl-acyl carrier protein thioesterase 1 [Carex littledalei]
MSILPLRATSLISSAASVQYQYRQHSLINRVNCSMTYSVPTLEKVKVNVTHRELTLGEKMRFGGFEGEELVYKERFVVKRLSSGANKTATIETIASLLQVT